LLEIQQNSDVTFRLFDYGRPRELHLDDAIAVASRGPYPEERFQRVDPADDRILVDGPAFTIVHCHEDVMQDRTRLAVPLDGSIACGDQVARPGECMLLSPGEQMVSNGARMLVGATPDA
jgi:mannose-6-phosphate isomerase